MGDGSNRRIGMILPVRLDDTITLFHNAMGGSEHPKDQLLRRVIPRVTLWAASRMSPALRAKMEPEDACQEILLRVSKDWKQFSGSSEKAFFAWLFKVGENCLRDLADHYNAQKRRELQPFAQSQTSASVRAMRSEQHRRLYEAISRLAEDHALVIRLRGIEQHDFPAIAEIMGRSENAIRILHCRALRELGVLMRGPGGRDGTASQIR